jgi:hypothetical protein
MPQPSTWHLGVGTTGRSDAGGGATGRRRHRRSDAGERRRQGAGDRGGWREESHEREWVAATRLHLWVVQELRPRIDIVYGSLVRDVFQVLQWSLGPHFEI